MTCRINGKITAVGGTSSTDIMQPYRSFHFGGVYPVRSLIIRRRVCRVAVCFTTIIASTAIGPHRKIATRPRREQERRPTARDRVSAGGDTKINNMIPKMGYQLLCIIGSSDYNEAAARFTALVHNIIQHCAVTFDWSSYSPSDEYQKTKNKKMIHVVKLRVASDRRAPPAVNYCESYE